MERHASGIVDSPPFIVIWLLVSQMAPKIALIGKSVTSSLYAGCQQDSPRYGAHWTELKTPIRTLDQNEARPFYK